MSPVLRKRLTATGPVAEPCTAESLQQTAPNEPEGVYTVCNTQRGGRVLHLDAHLDRLEESAARQGFALRVPRARLRQALRSMVGEAGFDDVRFRISAPRAAPDELLITLEPWQAPPEVLRRDGVRCVTAPGLARHDPAAKDSAWLQQRHDVVLPSSAYEALLVNPAGAILEGFSSNFHAIVAGELRTAGSGVLAGITRGIILQLVPDILPLRLSPVNVNDLPELDEAFISSSSRGLIPVVQIDGQIISDGRPGPYTLAIARSFQQYVDRNLEEL